MNPKGEEHDQGEERKADYSILKTEKTLSRNGYRKQETGNEE